MGSIKKIYKVIVSARATDMLIQHVRFLALISLPAAKKLRVEIVEAVKSLEIYPERNARLSDPMLSIDKYRKMVINKRYLLIYQIKADVAHVEYILDCSQDYNWLI